MTTVEDTRRLYRDAGARSQALNAIDHAIATMNSWAGLTDEQIVERRNACDDLRFAKDVLR